MPQIQLSDFEQRVWSRLDNDTLLYPQAQVDAKINEGARVVNLFTGYNQGTADLGLTVQNWMWYRVPTAIVIPMKVYLDGKELNKETVAGAGRMFPKWMRGVYNRSTAMWIPVGSRMFALVPPDGVGGKLLQVWGVMTPPLLVNPGDALTLDDEYANLIEEYAWVQLVLKEGGKVFADASRGYQNWLRRIGDLQMYESKISPRYWVEKEVENVTTS